jgi:hypothetical protein
VQLCFYNFLDIACALGVALVVNVAVLLVAAATFHARGITVRRAVPRLDPRLRRCACTSGGLQLQDGRGQSGQLEQQQQQQPDLGRAGLGCAALG